MSTEELQKLIEMFRENPVAAFVLVLPWLVQVYRTIRANAPAPTPGTLWATIAAILDKIVGVIPTAKVDAKPTAPAPLIATAVLRDHQTGEVIPPEGRLRDEVLLAGMKADDGPWAVQGRGRRWDSISSRWMRRRVRMVAWANDVDISSMDDSDIDFVISQVESEANQAGPLKDFFAWLIAHPEVILKFLTLFMQGEKVNAAHGVSL